MPTPFRSLVPRACATALVAWLALMAGRPALARDVFIPIFSNLDDWTFVGGKAVDGGTTDDVNNNLLRVVRNNDVAWWSMTYSFTLPSDARNFAISFLYLSADDRAVVRFNGAPVISFGIGGPGPGKFRFTADGVDQDRNFSSGNGEVSGSFTTGQKLEPAVNQLTVIVNNTNAGIGGATGATGPSSAALAAVLRYATDTPAATVPEPGAWLLWLVGLGGLGAWRLGRHGPSAPATWRSAG